MNSTQILPSALVIGALITTACNSDPATTATTLGPPTDVSATAGPGFVTVSWAPGSGAQFYNLYWSDQPGVTTATGSQVSRATSPYTLHGLSDQSTYFFVVTSLSDASESVPSNEVSASNRLGLGSLELPLGTVGAAYTSPRSRAFMCPYRGGVCIPCDDFIGCQRLPPCDTYSSSAGLCRKIAANAVGFFAFGGRPPYSWSAATMPPGLTLDPMSGRVSGVPTVPGAFSVSVTVVDRGVPQSAATADFSIIINPSP